MEVKEAQRRALAYKHYVLKAEQCAYQPVAGEKMDEIPHAYLRPVTLVEVDTFLLTHGPAAVLHGTNLPFSSVKMVGQKIV